MDGRHSEGSVARGWSRVVGVVAASGLLVAGLGVPGSAWAADASSCVVGSSTIAQCFPDAALARGVADANDVGTGSTLTTAVVDDTTSLYLEDQGIKSLTGIDSLTNLTSLWLWGNYISDVTPLKGLTQLTSLYLSGNKISDVTALGSLTNLTDLNLGDNKISDVTPLKNLTQLTSLDLSWNSISDLLKVKGLPDLTQLTSLDLSSNKISDVSPLSNLTRLTDLDLSWNGISDASALSDLNQLIYLDLGNQSVSAAASVSNGVVSLPAAVTRSGAYASVTATTPSGGELDSSTGRVTWSDASAFFYSYTFDDGGGFSGTVWGGAPAAAAVTVSLDANGGSVSPASLSVTVGSEYGELPTPSRSGYEFAGWFTAKTGGSQVTDYTVVSSASDHTLYARWTANRYAVSLDANGGSVSPASLSVTVGSEYGELPTPSRSGYEFAGWFTAKTGGSQVTDYTVVSVASDHTLYARWTASSTAVPVYRVYNRRSGLHHYTTNVKEKDMLVRLGWRDEGSSFNAVRKDSVNAKPVYREYNPHNGCHNWTMSKKEHDHLVKLGWRDEGVAWYVRSDGSVKVYRLYNPHSGEHVYTTRLREYNAVVRAGWHGEGVAWNGVK